jgi:hypothetical protein
MADEFVVEVPELSHNPVVETCVNIIAGAALVAAVGVIALQGALVAADYTIKKLFKRRQNAF